MLSNFFQKQRDFITQNLGLNQVGQSFKVLRSLFAPAGPSLVYDLNNFSAKERQERKQGLQQRSACFVLLCLLYLGLSATWYRFTGLIRLSVGC